MKSIYQTTREAAKLSITEMASYLGVDQRTVRRYEDGTRTPGGPVNKLYERLIGECNASRSNIC